MNLHGNSVTAHMIGASETLPFQATTTRIAMTLELAKKIELHKTTKELVMEVLKYHKKNWLNKNRIKTYTDGKSSTVSMLPTRGCVITDLTLMGKKIFYNDMKLAQDMTKSLRGGFWMFPYAGPASKDINMGYNLQHGYGRNVEWKEKHGGGFYLNNVDLLEQDTAPYMDATENFLEGLNVEQNMSVNGNKAFFILSVKNDSEKALPCAPGNHTYYNCPADQKHLVYIEGTDLDPDDIASYLATGKGPNGESTLKVRNTGKPVTMFIPGLGTIVVRTSSSLPYFRIRTEIGKPFICLEPVARRSSQDGTPLIQPGEKKEYSFSIELLEEHSN